MKIKIKKLHPNAVIPKPATKGSACSDLVATEIIEDDFNELGEPTLIIVKLGFNTEIPEGYKMCISPRSSFTKSSWLMQNSPGQIDSDYRGEWMIKFRAIPLFSLNDKLGTESFPYKEGDRVAQCWLEKIEEYEFEETFELEESERIGGFGSTGVN